MSYLIAKPIFTNRLMVVTFVLSFKCLLVFAIPTLALMSLARVMILVMMMITMRSLLMIMNATDTSMALTDLAEVRAQRLLIIIRLRNVAVIDRGMGVRHLL